MRLWSLHPSYLDTKGLLALWREALLAQAVLRGSTRGYRHHPQLARFRNHPSPCKAIVAYLWHIYLEAARRGYVFDMMKLGRRTQVESISVTIGQVEFEVRHLLKKLMERDPARFSKLRSRTRFRVHPLFKTRPGDIESWERQ
jgi:hypothetical protein